MKNSNQILQGDQNVLDKNSYMVECPVRALRL